MRRFLALCVLFALIAPGQASPTLEEAVVAEVNLLRTQPQTYARFVREEMKFFDGKVDRHPGLPPMRTTEGLSALEEAADYLDQQAQLGSLERSLGLSLGCLDHVRDQGRSGDMGHPGSDHSMARDRVSRYGTPRGVGENIIYGSENARDIVLKLVIDDGVPDRGHRLNFFQPQWQKIGVAYGSHPRMRQVCVITMADSYSEDASAQAGHPLPSAASPLAASSQSPKRGPSGKPLTPIQEARAAAESHYKACLNQDKTAWIMTFSAAQRPYAYGLWRQSQENSSGSTYVYGCTEKASPTLNKFRYLRNTGGKITPCFITMLLESGRWAVDDVTY